MSNNKITVEQFEKFQEEILKMMKTTFNQQLEKFGVKANKTEPRRWKPDYGMRYVRQNGLQDTWKNNPFNEWHWKTDDVHNSEEEASRVKAMYDAWHKFRSMADGGGKYIYVAGLHDGEICAYSTGITCGVPRFSSKESCERAINTAGRENIKAYIERQEWIWKR